MSIYISLYVSIFSLIWYSINNFKPMTAFCVVQNELGRSQTLPRELQRFMKYNMQNFQENQYKSFPAPSYSKNPLLR